MSKLTYGGLVVMSVTNVTGQTLGKSGPLRRSYDLVNILMIRFNLCIKYNGFLVNKIKWSNIKNIKPVLQTHRRLKVSPASRD